MKNRFDTTRRGVLKLAGGLAVAGAFPATAFGQNKQIVVADPGGPYTAAYRKAFYDPFEKATGIRVINVAREAQPVAQLTAMVKTKNFVWDVTTLTVAQDIPILEEAGLLEPLGLKVADFPNMLAESVAPNFMGVDVYSTVLAYRSDKYGKNPPSSWADFWNVEKFPGRRALRRNAIDTLEQALMADGVSIDKLYPLDLDRAFKSLDRIKPHVAVWWTSGAQAMQLIQSGEVDMISTWNARAQTAIEGGAAVAIVWNQGLYSIEGWGVPKGTPRAEEAKAFVKFCADAARQAAFTDTLAYGPTNLSAYQNIPAKRAAILPTSAANLKLMRAPSAQWWHKNRNLASDRFNAWLLS
ncbi:MAG: transporter substrate-binding protein [Collimonas fungivorans]|uniref:ABC transporter substrate-binding protein n=1 Tax=Collimonas fungivorans TaxID=158899 RepID=UPI0026EDD79A|nr:ABC transporter substrate-binding protein [Collimonas fungivorans]MDB5768464.1 transporter substrate-binding protein [Collimonas fungivorans]